MTTSTDTIIPSAVGTSLPEGDSARWRRLVGQISGGGVASFGALEELYEVLGAGVRFYLWRQLGPQDVDDRLHDIFLIVRSAIVGGEIREPERLMGFVHTVVRRYIAGQIDQIVHTRHRMADLDGFIRDKQPNPEVALAEREQKGAALRVLGGLHKREREILARFYLLDESAEQVCLGMHITMTQFRLGKSRAKARFGDLGRAMLKVG